MDEEEELENTLIGQQEEAPAVNTGDALMGAGQPMFATDSNVVAAVPGIENIRNPGAFNPANVEPVEPVSPPATIGESIRQTYDESVLADLIGRGFGQEAFQSQAPDGTPTFSIFNKRFGTLGSQVPYSEASPEAKAQAINFMLETGGQERPLPETPTSPVRTPEQVQSILNEQRATQAPPVESALGATPSVAPPLEMITAGAQEQPQTAVSPFLQSPDTPSGLGGPLLRGFEMVNDAARGPNAPMGQDATRARLGGMTLNEYLNAPAGTPGVSGLRTDPQGRMVTPAAPVSVNNFAPQASGSQVGPAKVPDEIMSQVVRTGAQTAEFRDGNRDGIEDREQGIFRPGELIGYDAQGNEVRSPGTQQPVNRIPASSQTPVDALSSFERDSLARQQRIGGTGSFAGDSAAREARLRANERQPGESQTERDTRIAQSRTTGGQTVGMSFDDARRRAEGQLAARGVRNPSASQVNALARGIQAAEPERLAELETKRAINEARLKTAQATLDRPEFEGKVYTVNGVTFAQTSRGGAQVIDTGTETPEQSTAQIQNFEFTLDQIDKAREAYSAGDVPRANDILTAAGIQKNGIDVTANEYFGDFSPQVPPAGSTPQVTDTGFTQQQEANIQKVLAANPNNTRAEVIGAMEKAGKL
jgi:hypothetical protein